MMIETGRGGEQVRTEEEDELVAARQPFCGGCRGSYECHAAAICHITRAVQRVGQITLGLSSVSVRKTKCKSNHA